MAQSKNRTMINNCKNSMLAIMLLAESGKTLPQAAKLCQSTLPF